MHAILEYNILSNQNNYRDQNKDEPNHIKLFSFFSRIGYKAYSNLSFQKEIIFRDKKSNSLTRSTYKVKNLAPQNL